MGNTSSSETPSKATPQKLCKPRVGSHVPVSDLLSPSGISIPGSTEYPNSRFAGSWPRSNRDKPPCSLTNIFPAVVPEQAFEGPQSTPKRFSRGDRERASSLPRPSPPVSEHLRGRRSSIYEASNAAERRLCRPQSLTPNTPVDPSVRTYSLPGHQLDKRRSLQSHETYSFVSQKRATKPNPEFLQELQAAAAESHHEMRQLTKSMSNQNSPSMPPIVTRINRTTSDLSLYAPVRRRSIIQTPGLATRTNREETHLPRRSSGQGSHPPPALVRPKAASSKSRTPRHRSMPPRPSEAEPLERAITPCESEYRQLGTMKFGSLRITNGSPTPSLAPEKIQLKDVTQAAQSFVVCDIETVAAVGCQTTGFAVRSGFKSDAARSTTTTSADDAISPVYHLHSKPAEETALEKSLVGIASPTTEARLIISGLDLNIDKVGSTNCQKSHSNPCSPIEFPYPEVLNIRQDPDAKSANNNDFLTLSTNDTLGVTRSDSGFGSTSSSDTSRRALSKADSGYSSNLSLRSVRSFRHRRRDSDPNARSNSCKPAIETKKSQCTPEKPRPQSSGATKHSRLHRLFLSEKKGLSSKFITHDISDAVPAVPSSVAPGPQGSNNWFSTTHERFFLKDDNSNGALKTIFSVDNLELSQDEISINNETHDVVPDQASPPRSLKRSRSRKAISDIAQAATSMVPSLKLVHRKSFTRKKSFVERTTDNRSKPEDVLRIRDCPLPDKTRLPLDPPSTATAVDRDQSSPRSLGNRASAPDLRAPLPGHPHPEESGPERSPGPKSRPAPPVSLRRRSVIDPGIPPPIPPKFRTAEFLHSKRQTATQQFSYDVVRSGRSPSSPHVSTRDQRTHTLDSSSQRGQPAVVQSSRYPPVVRRPGHHRRSTGSYGNADVQDPPSRVLHSYNPPSYRGVPIRG